VVIPFVRIYEPGTHRVWGGKGYLQALWDHHSVLTCKNKCKPKGRVSHDALEHVIRSSVIYHAEPFSVVEKKFDIPIPVITCHVSQYDTV